MEDILRLQSKIRRAIVSFFLNKKLMRSIGLLLFSLIVILGITKACFFSSNYGKTYYLIARNIDWNGFHFTGKEPNIQAFAEELVLTASKEANLKVQFVAANSSTLLEDLRSEKYDAVFTFIAPNSLNEETYYFSDPLYLLGSVLVVRQDEDVHDLQDMEDKMIGISSSSSSIFDVAHYPSIIILTYDNMNAALNDLVSNKIDGVIIDRWSAHVNTHGFFDHQLKIATIPFTHEGLRLATLNHKDLQEFIKSFDDGFERVKVSGKYHELLHKWDLYDIE